MEEPLSARPDFLVLSNKVDEKKLKNPVQVQDDQQSPFLVDQNQNQNFQKMKWNQNMPILGQNLLQFQNSNNSLFSNHNNSFMNKQGSAVKGLDSVFSFNYDNMLPSSHLSVQKSEQNQNQHFQENQNQNEDNNNNDNNNQMNMRNSTSLYLKFQIQNSRKSSLNFDIFGENSNLEERQISLKQFEDENIEKYFQEEQEKDELNFGENIFIEQQQQSFNKDHPQQFQLFDQETDFGFKIQSQSKFANQPQLFYQQEQIQNKKQQQQTELQQESDFEMEFPPLDISNEMQEDTQTQTNINFAYQSADNNDKNNEIQNSIFSSNNDNSSTTLTTFNNKDFKEQNTTNFSDDNDNLFKTSFNNNNTQKNNELNNIWEISEKKITKTKKKQRDYDKNICRYLARQVIRCFVDKIYKSEVEKFCGQEIDLNKQKQKNSQNNQQKNQQKNLSIDELYNSCRLFLLGKIEFVTGHRAFQELLICEEQQEKFLEKCVFKRFTYWFLKNRALRYIISGAMSDKQSYLQFKNQVMLHYVKRPETWNANLVKNTNKKRKPRIVKIELD